MKDSVRKQVSNFKRATIEILSLLLPLKEKTVFADQYIWQYQPCFSCGPNVCYPPGQNHQIRILVRVVRLFPFGNVAVPTGIEECVQTCQANSGFDAFGITDSWVPGSIQPVHCFSTEVCFPFVQTRANSGIGWPLFFQNRSEACLNGSSFAIRSVILFCLSYDHQTLILRCRH